MDSNLDVEIPGFVVGRTIASGALGAILEGRRVGDAGEQPLALKVLSAGAGSQAFRRFARECSIAALLDHPNIVRTLEVLDLEQRQIIVMERLSGQTIDAVQRRRRPVPQWACVEILTQLLEGLKYIHSWKDAGGQPGGLVHADLTPRNLFLCDTGTLKILDFGTARLRHSLATAITLPGKVHGTFAFMSPEQARGAPADPHSDVFQAGGVAYYLFSGKAPHGDGEDAQLLERAATGRPQSLGALRPDLPLALIEWVQRAMDPLPQQRFADGGTMLDALRELKLGGRGVEALAAWAAGREGNAADAPGAPVDPMVGRTLGEFVVGERLGEGGSGVTYHARQPLLEREAVIKVLRPRHATDDVAVQRFLREARLASRLDHPYAAHVYAFGADPGQSLLWIAMERVRGTPLDALLKAQGPISLERFVPLLERVCEVVQTAHDHGIVHRDLKPANVMVLTRAGKLLPKLLDFGISKVIGAPAEATTQERTTALAAGGTLTHGGDLVGSPAYMAPEQWLNAGAVGPSTDLYALGVLAYEALTGRRPFTGKTVNAIARAHATQTVPPLGETFPAALDRVFQRVLSKRAEDRYANALELAAAFRAAARITDEGGALPQLDDDLRDAILTGAPQPLAEAVTGLEAARSAHQARDQVWGLVRVSLRYLALVALACRTRMGAAGIADSDRFVELLVALRRSGLSDEQWLELTRELCRPFAHQPHSYPVPEIVNLLFVDGAQAEVPALEALFALRHASEAASGAADADVRVLLTQAIPELARWLRALSFLADYRLAVPRAGRAELWMGVRRLHRPSLPLANAAAVERHPLLVDGQGRPVLSLWPVVQVAEPMAGVAEELFLLEGRGRRGARLTASPTGFEREDEQLWEAVAVSYFITVQDGSAVRSDEKPPYRGLSAFTTADAAQFFGREREVEELLNRMKVQPFIAVVGPSGAGKSSFVHAGLVPALGSTWRCVSLRPGSAPLAALTARLATIGVDVEAAVRSRDAEAVGAAVRRASAERGEPVLVVVDQFEELLTLTSDTAERHFFAEALRGLGRSAEDPVRLLITLRDDFLLRAERLPALRDRLAAHLQLVTTPDVRELRRILVEPARRCGYEFDDPALPDEMVSAVAEAPGALALLSFTAAKMWDARDRHFRQLRREAYQALGGVGGALAKHADETLQRMTAEEQRLVREAFRHLVTSEGTRAVLTREELIQLVGGGAHGDLVIERLVAARLLTASETDTGTESVEVTHEALLTAWPRLLAWRQQDAEGMRFREQLRTASKQWSERGRPGGLLWRREALAEYRLWRARHAAQLTDVEEAFGSASLRDAARGRRRIQLVAAAAFVLLTAGLLVLQAQRSLAVRSAQRAKDRLAELYEEQGRQALLAGDALHAGAYLIEAHQQGLDTLALQYLVARASGDLAAEQRSLRGHPGGVSMAAFSPDGSQAVTAGADGTAKLWDVASGRLRVVFAGHQGPVYDVRFDAAGKRLVTAGEDAAAIVWDTSGRKIATLKGHKALIVSAVFTPDGRQVVTGSLDGTARVWEADTGKLISELKGHAAPVPFVPVSPDGTRIATPTIDKTTRIWDLQSGQTLVTLRSAREFLFAAFSPDGTQLVTGSADRTARVWDVKTGALRATLTGHANGIGLVAFSPDGKRVLTGSVDKTARVWDARTGELLAVEYQPGNIRIGGFCSDGIRIVTASDDGLVRVWDSRSGVVLATFLGHLGPVLSAVFSASCDQVITSSTDGTARIWSTQPQRFVRVFAAGDYLQRVGYSSDGSQLRAVSKDLQVLTWDAATGHARPMFDRAIKKAFHMNDQSAWFSPDGRKLVTAALRQVDVWDLATAQKLFSLPAAEPIYYAGFSSDGRWVATSGKDRLARLWDASTGALVTTLRGHKDSISWVDVSPDGKRAVTAGVDLIAGVWELPGGALLKKLEGHQGALKSARFSRDGRRIVTASDDGTAKLWDTESGAQLASLDGHKGNLAAAAFDAEGRLVVTTGDMTVKLWDVEHGTILDSIDGRQSFDDVDFSPDGSLLVTASREPAVTEWRLPAWKRPLKQLIHELGCRTPYRVREGKVFISPPDPSCGG